MVLRSKNGEFRFTGGDVSVLLEFLGVKKDAAGLLKVAGDVELIAAAPIFSDNRELVTGNGFQDASAKDTQGARDCQGVDKTEGVRWTLSTFDLDRYGERIDPLGWDFSQYMKNPVIQWAHSYLIPAIGRADGISVDEKGLHGVLRFNDKAFDPFGWAIGERVKAGVIRAGSVGFRVIEIEIPDKETAKDGTSLIFRKQELLEFSICNVPANPYALAKSINAANTETEQELNRPAFWGGLINNL